MTVTPRNPVQYADTTLGVHTEYETLVSNINKLDTERKLHVQLVGTVRSLRLSQEEYEQDVARKVRIEYPDLSSQAAFERKLKEVLADDEIFAEVKREIVNRQTDAEHQEAVVRNLELLVKAGTARIGELDALLHFYASHTEAKSAARRQVFDPVLG